MKILESDLRVLSIFCDICLLGMGPMPWTINSEIYPTWARSFCTSVATSFNWAFNLIISMTFLSLTEAITKQVRSFRCNFLYLKLTVLKAKNIFQGAFYLYTAIAIVAFVLFYVILPETKGKSLEEMDQLFSKPVCQCKGRRQSDSNPILAS